MAIPGTREYYDEAVARRNAKADEARKAAEGSVSARNVGLDIATPEPVGTPVSLSHPSMDVAPAEADVVVSRAPAPREPRSGSDTGVNLGGGKRAKMREAALASMEARGMPRPQSAAHELAGAEGVMADSYEQAGLNALSMQGAKQISSVANPDYGPTKEYVGTSRDINGRAMDAQVAIDEAEMMRSAKVADFMEEQSTRQAEAITDMRARQHVQEENALEAQERSKAAYGLVAKTTERLASAPDVDPGRWWASRSNGQKVAATIGMMGRGLGGGNPQDFLMEHIDRDIDAQKASFAQAATAAGAAQSQMGLARGLYADIRAQTQDEREADEIMRIAKLEQAKADFEAIAARSAIPSVMAAQNQHRLQLEQLIADRKLVLDKLAVHNVKRKTIVTPAYRVVKDPQTGALLKIPIAGPGQMAAAKYMLDQADKSRGASRDVLATDVKGAQAIEGDLAKERVKQSGAPELSDADSKLLMAHVDNTQKAGVISDLIENFIADYGTKGIPGRGISSATDVVFSPNERADANARLSQIVDSIGRLQSGGAITSDEAERFEEWINAGFGDDRLIQNLRNIQQMATASMKRSERALPDRLRAQYRRMDEGFTPRIESDAVGAAGRTNRLDEGRGGVVSVDETR